ncbi:MAG TPA: hypothetical protein VHT53_05890 [Candidatus Elarobacter sp.]|jgi:predicted lipoprotein with Yx(FWY)xxD motif|nr:hypothetical protein [Candidatus Elarobacter sp.]
MNRRLVYFALSAVLLAACGGGGSSGGATPVTGGGGSSTSSQSNLPVQDNVAGGAAWVEPSSHKTLYFLDVDTATGGTCTQAASGCLSLWPPFTPIAGSVSTQDVTIITRSDGTGQQWAYQTHPLYTYAGDNGPDQANGDNFPDFGGHWHVARPSASTAPTPPAGGPPCSGAYC